MSRAPGSQVLRMLDTGASITEILVSSGWEGDEVRELAREQGFGFNAANGRAQRVRSPRPSPVSPITRPLLVEAEAVAPATPTAVGDPAASRPLPLIRAGLRHDDARIRTAASRAQGALDQLAGLIAQWDQKAEARERIRAAEAALDEARVAAGLKPLHKPTPPVEGLASTVARRERLNAAGGFRVVAAWCDEHGIDRPRAGSVMPNRVLDAYEAAHPATGAAQ